MTGFELAIRYGAFAVVATVVNLGLQRVIFAFGDTTSHFVVAVIIGTGAGLVVKYILDKRWIFFDDASGLKAHSSKFALYTAMGLVTTAIFWGTEWAFWRIWGTDGMRELGAIIGLAIGYVTKYELDRRYVFSTRSEGTA